MTPVAPAERAVLGKGAPVALVGHEIEEQVVRGTRRGAEEAPDHLERGGAERGVP